MKGNERADAASHEPLHLAAVVGEGFLVEVPLFRLDAGPLEAHPVGVGPERGHELRVLAEAVPMVAGGCGAEEEVTPGARTAVRCSCRMPQQVE